MGRAFVPFLSTSEVSLWIVAMRAKQQQHHDFCLTCIAEWKIKLNTHFEPSTKTEFYNYNTILASYFFKSCFYFRYLSLLLIWVSNLVPLFPTSDHICSGTYVRIGINTDLDWFLSYLNTNNANVIFPPPSLWGIALSYIVGRQKWRFIRFTRRVQM